jgi:hypothetical protein
VRVRKKQFYSELVPKISPPVMLFRIVAAEGLRRLRTFARFTVRRFAVVRRAVVRRVVVFRLRVFLADVFLAVLRVVVFFFFLFAIDQSLPC